MVLLQDIFASHNEWFLNATEWLNCKAQRVILEYEALGVLKLPFNSSPGSFSGRDYNMTPLLFFKDEKMKSLKSIFTQISEVSSITQCAVIRSNVLFCRNISEWSRVPFFSIVAKGTFVSGIFCLSEWSMYSTYSVSSFCKTALPTNPLCFLKHVLLQKLFFFCL